MHDKILFRRKTADFVPPADFLLGKKISVADCFRFSLFQMIVYIVADNQVGAFFLLCPAPETQDAHQLMKCSLVQPIVRIHNLEINSVCEHQPCVDTGTMPAVFLVHNPNHIRVCTRILICKLSGSIRRPIIHQNDFQPVALF